MATEAQINAIVGLYVAYFDRAPDPVGLQFWIDQLDNGRDFTTISQDFANSSEAQAIYPYLSDDNDLGTISPVAFITNIYANLFGRVPDQEGLEFWTEVLESGAVAPGDMVEAISLGAYDDPDNTGFFDRTVLDNKIECARYFTEQASQIPSFPMGEPGEWLPGSPEYLAAVGVIGAAGNDDASIEQCKEYVDSILRDFIPNSSFTLCEVKVEVPGDEITELQDVTTKVLYWGFSNTQGTEAGSGPGASNPVNPGDPSSTDGTSVISNGIPADAFFGPGGYLQTVALQEFAELDVIDTDMDQFSIIDFSSVTDISLTVNNTTNEDDDSAGSGGTGDLDIGGGIITFSYTDGSSDDIALGQAYFDFLCKLILDEDGNTRFYEQDVVVGVPVYVDANGELTTVPQPGQEPLGTIDGQIEVGTGEFEESTYVTGPIVLTPTENNGGTKEAGFTSDDNDFIQVGQVDLLHGAIIDGGGGFNTLEIDAKGHFAQPKALSNIQQISIENLPNIYTSQTFEVTTVTTVTTTVDGGTPTETITTEVVDSPVAISGTNTVTNQSVVDGVTTTVVTVTTSTSSTGDGEPISNYPDVQEGAAAFTAARGTVIDLSRAIDLENLTITEGDYLGLLTGQVTGGLNVVGVRGDATLTLQGAFTENVYVQTSEGNSGDGFTVILQNVNADQSQPGSMFISQNSPKLNLVSEGGANYIRNLNENESFGINGHVVDLEISGSARLFIESDLAGIMEDDTPVTIDASANTGGVDLNITGGEFITFTGSQGDDRFSANTSNDGDTSRGGDPISDAAVTITNTAGDNYYDVQTQTLTITDGDGDIQVEAAGVDEATVTLGDGDNIIAMEMVGGTITVGDGDNTIDLDINDADLSLINKPQFDKDTTIVAGNGANKICVDIDDEDYATVGITAGDGGNDIQVGLESSTLADINITTGTGEDKIAVKGNEITINSGGGGDKIVLVGTDNDFTFDEVDVENGGINSGNVARDIVEEDVLNAGVLLNIDTGTGSAEIHLGVDGQESGGEDDVLLATNNLIAKDGSVITGEDITLHVNTYANLIAADMTGVGRVVLDDDAGERSDSASANSPYAGDRAQLTLTAEQFLEIGAENFSVDGATFNTHAFIKLIISEDTNLSDLGLDDLQGNIDLYIEINDGAEVTMTAEQLHTKIARDGVTIAEDGNTDYGMGSVVVTGGGLDFDPFNTNDRVKSIIAGSTYYGGSLSQDFMVEEGQWFNVNVKSVFGGYDRPADVVAEVYFTIDADSTAEVGAFDTWHSNVEIVGNQDIDFTGPIQLGLLQGENNELFTVDFSSLEGVANGLTLGNFEMVEAVHGNSTIGYETEVFVEIDGNSLDDDAAAIAQLNAAQSELDAAQQAADDAAADVALAEALLAGREEDLAEAEADLEDAQSALAQANAYTGPGAGLLLFLAQQAVNTAQAEVTFREGLVTTAEGELATAQAELATQNSALAAEQEEFDIIASNIGTGQVGFEDDNKNSEDPDDRALISQGVQQYTVTVIEGNGVMTPEQGDTATIRLCDETEDLEVIALRGNWNDTLQILDAAWGLDFELQAGGTLKREGPTKYANVGSLEANFKWYCAETTVDIFHSLEGDTRTIKTGDIELNNVEVANINVTGDAIIESISGENTNGPSDANALGTINIDGTGDVEVVEKIDISEGNTENLDASDVVGTITVGVDGNGPGDDELTSDFTFTGAQGGSTLTLCDVDDDAAEGVTIDGGAAGVALVIEGAVDLDESTLTNVTSVTLTDDSSLRIDLDDVDAIGAENFNYEPGDGGPAQLTLVGLNDQEFALANFDPDIDIIMVALADDPVITLNPLTDLSGIDMLEVAEGQTLNLTALQFQQMVGNGIIMGKEVDTDDDGIADTPTTDFIVNITDVDQAAIDFDDPDDTMDGAFILDGITADTLTLTLIEDVSLGTDDSLGAPPGGTDESIEVIMPDDTTITVASIEEIDGVDFTGGANTTINVTDNTFTAGFSAGIDAGGFDVDLIRLPNTLVGGRNVDALLDGLPERVVKEIYTGTGFVDGVVQTVILEEGTTVLGNIGFIPLDPEVEIAIFNLIMEGGTEIFGDLILAQGADELTDPSIEPPLLQMDLQEVNISSTGTAENILSAETTNIIDGDLTPLATGLGGSYANNDLLTVNIAGDQAFELTGSIVFNSTSGSLVPVNDDDEATATLNVNSSASVDIGELDTSADSVDALIVNNTGSGDLTIGIDGNNVDDTGNNVDSITINGGAGIDTISVENTLDLSDDTLNDVDVIEMDNDPATVTLTLTQAQFNEIGVAAFQTTEDDDVDDGNAILNLVEFDGSVAFDATGLDADIRLASITMTAGSNVMNPATNLTGIGQIIVPEGGSLTLTADQFQQLSGNGMIVGVDSDGNPSSDYTLNITNLGQSNVDLDPENDGTADMGSGFKLTGVTADTKTVTIDEDTDFDTNTALNGASVQIADFHLGLATNAQADGLSVTGGSASTVSLLFEVTTVDAANYDIDTLRVFDTSVAGEDVEQVIDNLSNDVTLNIFETTLEVGFVSNINRVLIIEPGTQISTPVNMDGLFFNALDEDGREMRSLTITFQGDATDRTESEDQDGNIEGAVIYGDLVITRDDGHSDEEDLFGALTLRSEGPGDSNAITGDVTSQSDTAGGLTGDIDNNLLDVEIVADAAFEIGGSIIFNSEVETQDEATLTVSGAAPITIGSLDTATSTEDVNTLNIVNNGADLTVTGASPSLTLDMTESVVITGSGSITFGTVEVAGEDFADGIDGGGELSNIDASGFAGALSIETVTNVDVNLFSFTAGAGETSVNFRGITIDDDANPATPSGWTLDFSDAAVGSEVRISGTNTFTDGSLDIDLGANTTLYIDADTDWTDLDLSVTQGQPIVLADGVTLTLTAAQASGLNIVEGPDTGGAGFTGKVVIDDLGAYPDTNGNGNNDDTAELIDYDFSGIMVPAEANLADNDVTLSGGTDLGTVAINLIDLPDGSGPTPSELVGQTIRFSTEEQAARDINVGTADGDSSTNVIWLFDSISGPVDTSDYDAVIGRVWFLESLVNGANVEDLFTSLPTQILRVDFATLGDLPTLLTNLPVNRTIELAALTDLPLGLTFSDQDQLESVQTLTVDMGGDVTVGDILIDNVIDNTGTYAGGTPTFDSLVFNSVLADDTGDLLAADGFDESDNVKPLSGNEVGDIGVGTENNIDLLSVTVNTGIDEGTNDTTNLEGVANDVLTGTSFTAGTITFDSDTAGATASFTVNGENDVTVKSLDTSDPDVLGVVITNNLTAGATLTVTGGSPAVDGGAVAGNTEDVNIVVFADSITTFGSEDGGTTYAGIYGETLSLLDLSGPASSTINLGVVASVDSEAFTLTTAANAGVDVDGDTNDDSDAATFEGDVTLTLGEADANGAKSPELSSTGTWNLDFSAANSAELTITDDVIFNAGGTLDINSADITIEGAVDLSVLGNDLTLTDVTFDVPAGSSLTLTAEQADGLTITGGGDVVITGVEDAATPGTLDFSGIMTTETAGMVVGDTGTVTVNVDTSDGPDADALPETITLDAELMGVANIVVAGDGTLEFTNDFVGYNRDGDALTPDDFASITVGAAATVNLTDDQADGLVVDGGGTVAVTISLPSSADLSAITAATVTATVTGTDLFDGDFGTAEITVADGAEMTVAFDLVTGRDINEVAAPAGTGIVNVTLDATAAAADLSTIGGDLEDLNAVVVEDMTFTGDFDGADVIVDAVADPVTLTVDAGLIDGLSVDGEGAGAGDENLVITGLSSNLDVDLSGVGVNLDSATADFDADGTFTGDLGPVVVTILNGVTMTASASVVAGSDLNKEADAPSDGAVAVTLSATVPADASVDLSSIPGGSVLAANVASITVLDSLTFTGVIAGAAVDVDVADGATLSLAAGIIDGQTVNAAGTTGAVAVDASGFGPGTLDLNGSANYTVTDLGAGASDDVNVEDVTGTVDVELDSASADPTVTVGATTGATNIDGDNLTVGVTITVNGAGDATVTTIDGNIDGTASTGDLTINGGTNDNNLTGGAGDDTITDNGGAVNNLTGNGGLDTFVVTAGSSTITDLQNGDALQVSAGATAVANLTGTFIATAATSNDGTATLNLATVGLGVDLTAAGGANGFTINGSTAGEQIIGSGSDDTIDGGAGIDDLSGGGGADTFVFASGDTGITVASADVINGFLTTVDAIDVGTIFFGDSYAEADGTGNNEAAFIVNANASFTGGGAKDTYVEYNADGSGNAWAVVDRDFDGTVSAGDTFLVLVGIGAAGQIDGADFGY